jgi:L-ascorbate metabolism protein UlaG (beta-lactamase superfamily)
VIAKISITAVEAVHSSGFSDGGKILYGGVPIGFIIQEVGATTLYHAGDTGVFSSMAEIRKIYHPAIALSPIGGGFCMKPREAACAAELLGVKTVVPMHFGTFPMLTGSPSDLKTSLKEKS